MSQSVLKKYATPQVSEGFSKEFFGSLTFKAAKSLVLPQILHSDAINRAVWINGFSLQLETSIQETEYILSFLSLQPLFQEMEAQYQNGICAVQMELQTPHGSLEDWIHEPAPISTVETASTKAQQIETAITYTNFNHFDIKLKHPIFNFLHTTLSLVSLPKIISGSLLPPVELACVPINEAHYRPSALFTLPSDRTTGLTADLWEEIISAPIPPPPPPPPPPPRPHTASQPVHPGRQSIHLPPGAPIMGTTYKTLDAPKAAITAYEEGCGFKMHAGQSKCMSVQSGHLIKKLTMHCHGYGKPGQTHNMVVDPSDHCEGHSVKTDCMCHYNLNRVSYTDVFTLTLVNYSHNHGQNLAIGAKAPHPASVRGRS
ncbi:hypothetical protein M422DRAFT_255332 [Sphaerobolus stellatus SS14]|uniref:Uncharacterized protein n=1 Tax=Sphaerobolus stellatus (strain SS14) TaxID=990650 RepID=A0A0C9VJC5_SPHS4|nr:hypothetical protein M422DRAFT_255332 [Sphaerobolus stellatus SS14]